MIRRFLRSEQGISLAELAIASIIAAVVVAGVTVWMGAVLRADARQQDRLDVIAELRYAKGQITSELRFATEIYPPGAGDDKISFWLDGGVLGTAEAGETITYEIIGTDLTRSTNAVPAEAPSLVAEGLVAADSAIVITGDVVDIKFTVDFDVTDSHPARSIETSIKARNT
ncbi:MAG: hypothetical protein OEM94_08535 [Acidimicrobiia bacterium]|nr:hypothetical protein [Acidimicrobiia bacterium]